MLIGDWKLRHRITKLLDTPFISRNHEANLDWSESITRGVAYIGDMEPYRCKACSCSSCSLSNNTFDFDTVKNFSSAILRAGKASGIAFVLEKRPT